MDNLCLVCKTKTLLAGSAFVNYTCCDCKKVYSYPCTAAPLRCYNCSKNSDMCQRCSNNTIIKVGIKYNISLEERDGRKRRKLYREIRFGLEKSGWEIVYWSGFDERLWFSAKHQDVTRRIYIPCEFSIEAELYQIYK